MFITNYMENSNSLAIIDNFDLLMEIISFQRDYNQYLKEQELQLIRERQIDNEIWKLM